jgi:Coenzyme PQQ synthesis protein D (PqqD)
VAASIPSAPLLHYLPTDRFRPGAHVVWARQAGATVLLDGERGQYHTLNEVASQLWELVVAGEPLMEILRCLGTEYEVTPETLQADVDAILTQLLDAELIARVPR